jgi:hypothetical protein
MRRKSGETPIDGKSWRMRRRWVAIVNLESCCEQCAVSSQEEIALQFTYITNAVFTTYSCFSYSIESWLHLNERPVTELTESGDKILV